MHQKWPRSVAEPDHIGVILDLLYDGTPPSDAPLSHIAPPEEDRNREIYERYLAGARAIDLTEEYAVSLQRIYVLMRRYKRQQ